MSTNGMMPHVEPTAQEDDAPEMKIVVGKPPIWEEAHKHFRLDDSRTVYTYGDTLYNPGNSTISRDLMAHEATHADQQEGTGVAKLWWERYFIDKEFRFSQELEAYVNQYMVFCDDHHDRNVRARFLFQIARDLAGPTCGELITQAEAMKMIKARA